MSDKTGLSEKMDRDWILVFGFILIIHPMCGSYGIDYG